MSDIAIKVENVSKKYQIGENKTYPTLRDKLMELPNRLFKGPKKTKEFWALKDVSFEIKKGEVVGIIGRNGAGKSTMLKILARITEPTSGKITMYGRVASMLEVGTGFNPELTGRENIYLNGAIIGMKKSEINTKFDDIVEFSGVGKFLDTPVKHYSSGMYVRLAFAVAAHLDADILLVDEVLAVGDAEFQKKCLGKMDDLANSGKTVLFVSHSIGSVASLCSKCIWFGEGTIVLYDAAQMVIDEYLSEPQKYINSNKLITKAKNDLFTFKTINWISENGKPVNSYKFGDKCKLKIKIRFNKPINNIGFGVAILNSKNERVLTSHQVDDKQCNLPEMLIGEVTFIVDLELGTIAPGRYRTIIGAKDQLTNQVIFYSEELAPLTINQSEKVIDGNSGILWQTGRWKIIERNIKS